MATDSYLRRSFAQQLFLKWENVTVREKSKKDIKFNPKLSYETADKPATLKNVRGHLESGQLVALLGSSGSGKTTLLSAVSGRLPENFTLKGNVTLNGSPKCSLIRKNVALVDQFEAFPAKISPREHLVFNALLRLHQNIPDKEKINIVEGIIKTFGLTKCADNTIGIPGLYQGISGGERRRLGFATEAILSPPLFFCDEPITGLDSRMSMEVLETLKSMSRDGCGILCSIHQPSSSAFALFDKVMLMTEGRVAFYGTTDEALQFFSRLNFNCPEDFNPSDFFIKVLDTRRLKQREGVQNICNKFDSMNKANENIFFMKEHERNAPVIKRKKYRASLVRQLRILTWRDFSIWKHFPPISFLQLFLHFMLYLCMSLMARVHYPVNWREVTNVIGISAFMVSGLPLTISSEAAQALVSSLPVFYRERKKEMYYTGSFLLSHSLFQILTCFNRVLRVSTPLYWIIGLNSSFVGFIYFTFTIFCTTFAASGLGTLLAATIPIPRAVQMVIDCLFILLNSFNFFQHSVSKVTPCIKWIGYISWQRYGMESMSTVLWRNLDLNTECDRNDSTCSRTGTDVLHKFGMREDHLFLNIGVMLAMGIIYRILLFAFLKLKSKAK